MTKRDLLGFIFRYKNTILGWWVFVILIVAGLVYAIPQSYLAASSVLVERTKAPVVTTPNYIAPSMIEVMNTELAIIKSRPVLEAVADELARKSAIAGAAQAPEKPNRVKQLLSALGDFMLEIGLRDPVPEREGLIQHLVKAVKADPVVDSNVLIISYPNRDPAAAMSVVNAVTDAYMTHRRSVYSLQGASDYFRTKMEEAARELERLRGALQDFKEKYSISALEESKEELVREIGRIRDRLAELRTTRSQLETRFASKHPQVLAITDNVEGAQRELADRADELQTLETRQTTIGDLTVLINSQESLFLDYKTRYEQERAREATPENFVNTRVIEYAPLPAKPRHSRLFYIALGAAGGMIFAVLIAFMREYFNRRVTTPEIAERSFGVPVMGSIARKRAIRHY